MSNDTLRITPEANAYGSDVLYLNATDSNGNWLVEPFRFDVVIEPINDPPRIKKYLGLWEITEDSKLREIDLNDFFFDPIEPEQELEFGYEEAENVDVHIQSFGTKTTIVPHENWFGELSIRFFAFDGVDTVYNVMRLNVKPVNDPPVFQNPKGFTVNEGSWFYREMVAFDPVEGDEVRIETNLTDEVNYQLIRAGRISTPSQGGVVPGENLKFEKDRSNSSVHIFSFYPTNEMAGDVLGQFTGIYFINFTAVDSGGARVTRSVIMTILNVNQAPIPLINRPLNDSIFDESDLIYFFGDAGDPDVIHGMHNFYLWSSNIDGDLGKTKYLGPVSLSRGLHTITLEVGDGESVGRALVQVKVGREYIPPPPPPPPPVNTLENDDHTTFSLTYESKLAIAISIMLVLSVIAFGFTIRSRAIVSKRSKIRIIPETLKLPNEVQKILSPQKALCSHCGSTIQVISKVRPIGVKCPECEKRSAVINIDPKIESKTGTDNQDRKRLLP
jgi:hypothetical protein